MSSRKTCSRLLDCDQVMSIPSLLRRLSHLYGIQSAYRDGLGQLRQAPSETILRALQALGAPMERLDDIDGAYRQRRQALWQRVIEPVVVNWQNQPLQLKVRVPCQLAEAPSSYHIVLEDGAVLDGELGDDSTFARVSRDVESTRVRNPPLARSATDTARLSSTFLPHRRS